MRRNRKNEIRKKKIEMLIAFEVIVLLILTVVTVLVIKGAVKKGNLQEQPEEVVAIENSATVSDNTSSDITQEEVVQETAKEPQIVEQNVSPTSIDLVWEDTFADGYIVEYQSSSYDETSEFHTEPVKLIRVTDTASVSLTGLNISETYNISIFLNDGSRTEYLPEFIVSTSADGYCDPFKAIDATINVYTWDDATGTALDMTDTGTVMMSSANGCLGVEAKPIMDASCYADAGMTSVTGSLIAGTDTFITEDENGYYCYLSTSGDWVVHITSADGFSGWINARTLLIDINGLFSPDNDIYGIQINRTNAYSSIFTTGGNAQTVNDYEEDQLTRYNCLSENNIEVALSSDGYNVIDNITGQKLPNYGEAEQMPVIWDLALELKQCQKNALFTGYSIRIYDGYRPLSTSAAVSGELASQGYLVTSVNGTDLAQGYLTSGIYNINYYIAQKSRHNRGIAVDLTIVRFDQIDSLGAEAHMQTKMHTLDFRCNMETNTWEANLLIDVMTGHGSNLEYLRDRQEWWHFQLNTSMTDLYPLVDQYGYADIVF